MRWAAALMSAACVIQVLGYLYALPGHLGDPTWSQHAQFHMVEAFIWITGFDVAIVALAWGPLQRKERWSFWLLTALFVSAQGGHFLASAAVPQGRPAYRWYDWALLGVLLLYAIGLGASASVIYRARPAAQQSGPASRPAP